MPNRKTSALWEGIGAARQRSGMSQLAVAAAMGHISRAALFWNTVRLAVIDKAPELQNCFDVVVERGGLMVKVPFMHKRSVAFMFGQLARTLEQFLTDELPGILYVRALASRTPPDTLVLVSSDHNDHAELDGAVIDQDLCGCRFVAVQQVATAARLILDA